MRVTVAILGALAVTTCVGACGDDEPEPRDDPPTEDEPQPDDPEETPDLDPPSAADRFRAVEIPALPEPPAVGATCAERIEHATRLWQADTQRVFRMPDNPAPITATNGLRVDAVGMHAFFLPGGVRTQLSLEDVPYEHADQALGAWLRMRDRDCERSVDAADCRRRIYVDAVGTLPARRVYDALAPHAESRELRLLVRDPTFDDRAFPEWFAAELVEVGRGSRGDGRQSSADAADRLRGQCAEIRRHLFFRVYQEIWRVLPESDRPERGVVSPPDRPPFGRSLADCGCDVVDVDQLATFLRATLVPELGPLLYVPLTLPDSPAALGRRTIAQAFGPE